MINDLHRAHLPTYPGGHDPDTADTLDQPDAVSVVDLGEVAAVDGA